MKLVAVKALVQLESGSVLPVIQSFTNTERGIAIAIANLKARQWSGIHVVPFTQIHGKSIETVLNGAVVCVDVVEDEQAEFALEGYKHYFPELNFSITDRIETFFADLLEKDENDTAANNAAVV
nr:hypothetical protein [uncultured Haemophilus sp.]